MWKFNLKSTEVAFYFKLFYKWFYAWRVIFLFVNVSLEWYKLNSGYVGPPVPLVDENFLITSFSTQACLEWLWASPMWDDNGSHFFMFASQFDLCWSLSNVPLKNCPRVSCRVTWPTQTNLRSSWPTSDCVPYKITYFEFLACITRSVHISHRTTRLELRQTGAACTWSGPGVVLSSRLGRCSLTSSWIFSVLGGPLTIVFLTKSLI